MSETYPNKGTRKTLFAGHTPSSVGIDCKITNYFSFLQIKKPLMSKNINGNVISYMSCTAFTALEFFGRLPRTWEMDSIFLRAALTIC